ncbi:CocE/NonD family hydrolase [Microbacterium thalassium]|uniref:Putative acyl esterase n=1 Tax=Microbacterium thalassium TaxID=362649 RepID=A0A7X0FMN6_9MICO|nr:CocE/NonD family hydrolase [Microbacterium thalassium]MBB6390335.1 putative acyl esterase [Microbacterium thalassium]GLK25444.1 hydrolase [Microbacterium thalassium]
MPDIQRTPPAPESELAFPVRIRMRDGVLLAGDVYLPGAPTDADASPGDTILIRLPYDKSGEYCFIPFVAEYLMRHGYRVVAQDVRGKFRSQGDALLFVNEVDDGYDTIEWITQQSWSNGRVAMWGDSYYGYTQWAAAASGHPALKAISPRVTGTDLGEPVRRDPDGRTCDVEWAVTYLYPLTQFFDHDMLEWEPDWERRDFAAQAEEFMAQVGTRGISYDQWYPHPVLLPRFPNGDPFAGRSVPALHTIGWWDNCAPLSWADVERIRRHPNWDAHHHLRIESIDHEGFQLLDADDDRLEDRSDEQIRALLPRTLDPALEFFEVFVRGNGSATDLPRVTWSLAGTEEMRGGDAWPPAGADAVTRWATADGALTPTRPVGESTLQWTHDPADLVPSSAPDAFSFLLSKPDEAPLGERSDVLRFDTAPAAADVDLAGPVSAQVRVGSDGPVMDCFVRLLDVAPDGTALRIARGQQQLRGATEPAALTIDLGHVGYRLRAGHRLRVHVSSSDYPEFLPQTGTGVDPWTWGETRANTQSLTIGGPEGLALTVAVLEGDLP